jgi:hypothetical protein
MKRLELERHLHANGCHLYREGGTHSICLNPLKRKLLGTSTVQLGCEALDDYFPFAGASNSGIARNMN